MTREGRLSGTAAVVTGGGSGLGRAIAERFVAEGASVAIVDRNLDAAKEVAQASPAGTILPLQADVRDSAQLHAAVEATLDAFGRLDTLVPNAGIWDYHRSVTKLDGPALSQVFDEVMGINVKGYLLAVEASWRHLVASRGSIVMTLSNATFHANGGGPVYTASKHACLGLLREFAYELSPRVRVNGVACGGMRTGLAGPASLNLDGRSIGDSFARSEASGALPMVPLHDSSVEPADFTGAYVYLANAAESGNVTGAAIPADGGIAVRGFRSPSGGDNLLDLIGTT